MRVDLRTYAVGFPAVYVRKGTEPNGSDAQVSGSPTICRNMRTTVGIWKATIACGGMLMGAVSCRPAREEPDKLNEEELIIAVELHFSSAGGAEQKLISFLDADGSSPVITADTLSSDSVYTVEVRLYSEGGDLPDDITSEIVTEGTEHQFFFQVSGANATITYADADADGHPVGLLTHWSVGASGTGSVLVTLRHQPDKSAAGVSAGDITNAGGDTDIEITLPLVVE